MGFWEQADIEAALGAELAEALPDLLMLSDLEVRIPRLEVLALEKLAARDGKIGRRGSRARAARAVGLALIHHSGIRRRAFVALLTTCRTIIASAS
jgi:hypothetical protein